MLELSLQPLSCACMVRAVFVSGCLISEAAGGQRTGEEKGAGNEWWKGIVSGNQCVKKSAAIPVCKLMRVMQKVSAARLDY